MRHRLPCVAFLGWIGCAAAGPSGPFVPTRSDSVVKTDDQWRTELDAEEYRILREAGTERAFTTVRHAVFRSLKRTPSSSLAPAGPVSPHPFLRAAWRNT